MELSVKEKCAILNEKIRRLKAQSFEAGVDEELAKSVEDLELAKLAARRGEMADSMARRAQKILDAIIPTDPIL